jgi:hypothetical protein
VCEEVDNEVFKMETLKQCKKRLEMRALELDTLMLCVKRLEMRAPSWLP